MRSFFHRRSVAKSRAISSRVRLGIECLEERRQPATLVAPDLLSQYDTGASAFDNVTRLAQPAFAGTTSSPTGTQIALLIDDVVANVFVVRRSGGSTFITNANLPLSEGTHSARYFDASTGAYSAALSFTIALTPPDAPPVPTLIAGDDPGHLVVQVQGQPGDKLHMLVAGQDVLGVLAVGGPQYVNLDVSGLSLDPTSSFPVQVIAEDAAGNVSAASAALTVHFSQEGPAAPTDLRLDPGSDTGDYDDDGLTNLNLLTFVGTAPPGQTITLYVDGTPWTSQLVGDAAAFTLEAGPLEPGPHQVWVTATGANGFVGPASAPIEITVDATPPVLSDVTLTPDALSPNGDGVRDSASFHFHLSEAAYVGVYFLDSDDFNLGSIPLGWLDAGDQTFDLAVPEFTEGQYSIIVIASDSADNLGDWVEVPFTIDLTTPDTPTIALADGQDTGASNSDGVTNLTAPLFAGSAEPGATIELLDGTSSLGTTIAAADGSWSLAVELTEGTHSLIARAIDIAGNRSTDETFAVTIDTTAPTVDVGADRVGMEGDSITLVAQSADAIIGSQRWELVSSTTGQSVPNSNGTTLTFTPSHSGTYLFRHLATDAAGNVGFSVLTVTVTDAAPALHVTWPAMANLGGDFVMQLRFTDPGGDPLDGWVIQWGDGTTTELPGSATSATHVYSASGPFMPTVHGTQGDLELTATGPEVIVSANQVPTLTNTSFAAPATPEDAVDPAGVSIADLIAGLGVIDTPGSLTGLAITAADGSHGSWQYALDGAAWESLGTVSDAAARLLAANATTRLRFVPSLDWNGSVQLSARAWDQSDGLANGTTANVADLGETSVSSQSAAIAFAVTPVNDAPVLTLPTSLIAYRNTDKTIGTVFSVSDVDATRLRVTLVIDEGVIVVPSSQGLTFATGSGTPTLTLDGPIDVLNQRLAALIYRPTPGYLGAVSVAITVNDLGQSGSGGVRNATGTLAIEVVNRPPQAIANPLYAMTANTVLNAAAPGLMAAFVDLDGDPMTIILATPPAIGAVVVSTDGSFRYTPPAGFVGDVSFAVQAFDGVDFSAPLWVTIRVTSSYGLRR